MRNENNISLPIVLISGVVNYILIQFLFVTHDKESAQLAAKYFCYICSRSNYYDVKCLRI